MGGWGQQLILVVLAAVLVGWAAAAALLACHRARCLKAQGWGALPLEEGVEEGGKRGEEEAGARGGT